MQKKKSKDSLKLRLIYSIHEVIVLIHQSECLGTYITSIKEDHPSQNLRIT